MLRVTLLRSILCTARKSAVSDDCSQTGIVDAQDGLIDEGLVGAEVVLLLHVHYNRARVVRLLIRVRDHVPATT